MTLKALTIRQPWAWAIMHAGKDIENRDWRTNYKGAVAIHSAKGMAHEEYGDAREFMLGDIGLDDMPLISQLDRGAIIGVALIVGCVTLSDSKWFQGDYGFLIKEPKPLSQPIPCSGALGFWNVPDEIEKQIRASVQACIP